VVERFADDADPQVDEEHAEDDDEEAEEEDVEAVVVEDGLHLGADAVHAVPHDPDPPLRRHDGEQRDEGCRRRVEVQVGVHPVAPVVQAVFLRADQSQVVLVAEVRELLRVTPCEFAFKQGRPQNGKQENEEGYDHEQISDIRNRLDQGDDGEPETAQALDHAEGLEHAQHANGLQVGEVVLLERDRNEADHHDDEVEHAPAVAQVAALAVEEEAQGQDLEHHLQKEDHRHHIVDLCEDLDNQVVPVEQRTLQRETYSRDYDEEKDYPVESVMVHHFV